MISLRLPKTLETKLNQVSKKEDRTKSEIIKDLLEDYLTNYQSPKNAYEMGKEYFGKIKSGRADGSVNYKELIKNRVMQKHKAAK
ncbi:MAG: ribbon-helix-helix protein, CopG family [Leptospiraceae bacterium]|nr:ribbon-helix-helix protein, CopG family [Leptospiraceae bacterium]